MPERMPAWRREVDALVVPAPGDPTPRWVDWGQAVEHEVSRLPVVLSLIGHDVPAKERRRLLARWRDVAPPASTLIVVDHNRPRRFTAALGALLGAPWVPGLAPATRWRRLAYPTAREVQTAGFCVERLRLVAAERVQVVFARNPAA